MDLLSTGKYVIITLNFGPFVPKKAQESHYDNSGFAFK